MAGLLALVVGETLFLSKPKLDRTDVFWAYANYYSLAEFEGWALQNGFVAENDFFDPLTGKWRFPCSMRPVGWMLEKPNAAICFSRVVEESAGTSSEVILACVSSEDYRYDSIAIAHVDKSWPAGTWEGELLPEDYGQRKWCEFEAAVQR